MDVRKKIANCIKFIIFLLVTITTFFTIYAMIWVGVGFPIDWWSTIMVVAVSVLSEWAYVSWLRN